MDRHRHAVRRLAALVVAALAATTLATTGAPPATAESHTYAYRTGELRSVTFDVRPHRVVATFVVPARLDEDVRYLGWDVRMEVRAARDPDREPGEFVAYGKWRDGSARLMLLRGDRTPRIACPQLDVERTARTLRVVIPRRCLVFDGRRAGQTRLGSAVVGTPGGDDECFAVFAPSSLYSRWLDPDRRGSGETVRRRSGDAICSIAHPGDRPTWSMPRSRVPEAG